MLCENPWNGGAGYTPAEVGAMTPDQIYFRLCNADLLKDERKQATTVGSGAAVDKEGRIKGRLEDGTVVWLPLRKAGKTLAQQIDEQAETERAKKDKTRGTRNG